MSLYLKEPAVEDDLPEVNDQSLVVDGIVSFPINHQFHGALQIL